MNRSVPLVILGFALVGVLGWRSYVDHHRLTTIESLLERILAENQALGRNQLHAVESEQESWRGLRDAGARQVEALDRLVALESAKAPPTLAELRATKPDTDIVAVEAALKEVDSTGRVRGIEFLTTREMMLRFGTPSVTLAKDGVVTWIYKLDGFERLLRCEFVDGVVLAAYDR